MLSVCSQYNYWLQTVARPASVLFLNVNVGKILWFYSRNSSSFGMSFESNRSFIFHIPSVSCSPSEDINASSLYGISRWDSKTLFWQFQFMNIVTYSYIYKHILTLAAGSVFLPRGLSSVHLEVSVTTYGSLEFISTLKLTHFGSSVAQYVLFSV